MKQHITISQLNELSDKGKERFAQSFVKVDDWKTAHLIFERDSYFLPNIGQMIEFLDDHPRKFDLSIHGEWGTDGDEGGYLDFRWDGARWDGALIDKLWENVKEVLER